MNTNYIERGLIWIMGLLTAALIGQIGMMMWHVLPGENAATFESLLKIEEFVLSNLITWAVTSHQRTPQIAPNTAVATETVTTSTTKEPTP